MSDRGLAETGFESTEHPNVHFPTYVRGIVMIQFEPLSIRKKKKKKTLLIVRLVCVATRNLGILYVSKNKRALKLLRMRKKRCVF